MICYHGSPVGGYNAEVARFWRRRNAMVSFADIRDLPIVAEVCQTFVLDNGAFSAWKRGIDPDWQHYYEFVDQWKRHPGFRWAVIPDVIDGDENDNDALIAEWPHDFAGCPVWHFHESLERLIRLTQSWPTVALGSSGQWPTPGTRGWWDRCEWFMPRIVDDHGLPHCKLHGLRMLNREIICRLPLASADSTNAVRNGHSATRFGQYVPASTAAGACVIADYIESSPTAAHWTHQRQLGLQLT